MTMQICWNGSPIGEQFPIGKTLDKTAFLRLRKVERLRVYLLLAWPGARTFRTISRVCDIKSRDISNLLKGDLRDGVVRRVAPRTLRAEPQTLLGRGLRKHGGTP
jgi:hypothetical protein